MGDEKMKIEDALAEAKRKLELHTSIEKSEPSVIEYDELVVKALEKQIPKKPIDGNYAEPIYNCEGCQVDAIFMYRAECPSCNNMLCFGELEKSDLVAVKFCDNCGQAIDWSDEE